ncbi:MAG TPA: hypothetical protein PK867_22830, partial [Pirellulales bacterium]|nr:hypothetical protein [Pirellulales bacterium]
KPPRYSTSITGRIQIDLPPLALADKMIGRLLSGNLALANGGPVRGGAMPDARLRQLIDDFKSGDERVRGQALDELGDFTHDSRLVIRTLFDGLRNGDRSIDRSARRRRDLLDGSDLAG